MEQLFYWSVCVVWQTYYSTAVLLVCVLCGRRTMAQLFDWSVCCMADVRAGARVRGVHSSGELPHGDE